eukprot:12341039-Prorocentrum_lima.AAC.1
MLIKCSLPASPLPQRGQASPWPEIGKMVWQKPGPSCCTLFPAGKAKSHRYVLLGATDPHMSHNGGGT